MRDRDLAIREYFGPPDSQFWQWQDHGESFGWIDGKTIAFSNEIAAILQQFSSSEPPRIGALLLLVAATRSTWSVDGSETGLLADVLAPSVHSTKDADFTDTELLQRVLRGLHRVRSLDDSIRTSLDSKKAIAELVFENHVSEYSAFDAQQISNALRPGLASFLAGKPAEVSEQYIAISLKKDLWQLVLGLDRVTETTVRTRMTTGLGSLPNAALIEDLPPNLATRSLLEELDNSDEFRGLAHIAKRLLAVTNLPRNFSTMVDQELGGFSDITNRGTPDRLLLSELAQDGLTLAVRVAMNEAMYLHRENPPSVPRTNRQLLIDSGVRAWGINRIFSTAAAMAFAATVPEGARLDVWRGSGKTLCPVDLSTKKGLLDHLSALESDPHLADVLPELNQMIQTSDGNVETIVIMPEDSYTDPSLSDAFRKLDKKHLFVATVNPSGEFEIHHLRNRNPKPVRRSVIDLEQIAGFDSQPIDHNRKEQLPAVFRAQPFPFYLSSVAEIGASWAIGNRGALSVTNDGRLLYWETQGQGGEQLFDQMPRGTLLWADSSTHGGFVRFLFGTSKRATLFHLELVSGNVTGIELETLPTHRFISHNGTLFRYCHRQRKVCEINFRTGEATNEFKIPSRFRFEHQRFLVDQENNWHALSHNGQAITLENFSPENSADDVIVAMWDAVGFEGPLALTTAGEILGDPSDRQRIPTCDGEIYDCQVQSISPDGLVLQGSCRGVLANLNFQNFGIRLDQATDYTLFMSPYRESLDPRVERMVCPRPFRSKFKSIGVTTSRELALKSHKGNLIGFRIQQGRPLFTPLPQESELEHESAFESLRSTDFRFRLHVASWPDGSEAILDSRGILHLRAANANIPEFSIVLSEGEFTSWSTDGLTMGKTYFLRESEQMVIETSQQIDQFNQTVNLFMEDVRASN